MAEYRPIAVFPTGVRWSGNPAVPTIPAVVRKKDTPERVGYKRRLGLTLKEARKAAGIKQEAIAGDLDVDNDTVSRWETGAREIGSYNLAQLVDRYGITGDLVMNPPELISEVAAAVRRSRAMRAAAEAARADEADGSDRQGDEGGPAPRGRRTA